MTSRRLFQDILGNVDFTSSPPNLSSYSDMVPNQVTDRGSLLKNPILNPPKRQSLRLKDINAIYESEENSSLNIQQQTSEDNCSLSTEEGENLLPGPHQSPEKLYGHSYDTADSSCTDNYGIIETDSYSAEQQTESMTLKDLITRFRTKKRKAPRSAASVEPDVRSMEGDCRVKLEDESDLEEPLISLKLKLSKGSSARRKQKKRARHSYNAEQGSLVVDNVSSMCKHSIDNEADSNNLKHTTAIPEEKHGVTQKRAFIQAGEPVISSDSEATREAVHTMGNKSDNLSSESVEPHSLDGQKMINPSAPKLKSTGECNTLPFLEDREELDNTVQSCPTGKLLQLCGDGLMEMLSGNTLSSVPELESTGNDHRVKHNTRSEVPEACSPVQENTIHSSCSDNKVPERVDGGELKIVELTSFTNTSLHSCVHEVPPKDMWPENGTCLPQHDEESSGGVRMTDVSEEPSYQVLSPDSECKTVPFDLPSSVSTSAVMCHASVVCGNTGNPSLILVEEAHDTKKLLNDLAVATCNQNMEVDTATEFNMSENLRNLVDVPTQQIPKVCHSNDDEICQPLLHKDSGLDEASNSFVKAERINSLLYKVLDDEGINSDDSCANPCCIRENTSAETNHAVSVKHSLKNLHVMKDSHDADLDQSLTELSSMRKVLNDCTNEVACCFDGISNSLDTGITALHCLPTISPCSLNSVNILHHEGDNSSKSIDGFSSPIADEKMGASSTSLPVDTNKDKLKDALKCDSSIQVVDPPRKIFSNRKTFSPASQEKLLHDINGNALYDTIKHSGCSEVMAGPEKTVRQPKSSRKGSLHVTKGILKSPPEAPRKVSQTQEFITFTQRQMQDVNTITTILLEGLNTMKDIIEENVLPETYSATPSKFTADEIREATRRAMKIEANTVKMVAMMSKDCNRFCKILRSKEEAEKEALNDSVRKEVAPNTGVHKEIPPNNSAHKEVAPSNNSAHKERKKLTFADEAGGVLCHVKLFNKQPASSDT